MSSARHALGNLHDAIASLKEAETALAYLGFSHTSKGIAVVREARRDLEDLRDVVLISVKRPESALAIGGKR